MSLQKRKEGEASGKVLKTSIFHFSFVIICHFSLVIDEVTPR
jgi:hypothetical protein